MKKYSTAITATCLAMVVLFASCKKDDYKNGGDSSDPNVNMTTYDFFKSRPIFDSLVRMIDHAGLKDMVNGDVTVFAVTNYGIAEFMSARKFKVNSALGDENRAYTIDSIPADELRDSLMTYIYPGKVNRADITVKGRAYENLLGSSGDISYVIKLRRTQDYSSYLQYVDYVNFTRVVGTRDDEALNPDLIPQDQRDASVDCQTSGLVTTNGIVHVLDGTHRMFFNTERLP